MTARGKPVSRAGRRRTRADPGEGAELGPAQGPGSPCQSGPDGDEHRRLLQVLADAQRAGVLGSAAVEQHVEHAAGFLVALEPSAFANATVLDLGSGAGIPGLVIAQCCPSARVVLLEGSTVRAARLQRSVRYLGLDRRVDVVARRAEEAGRDPSLRGRFDVVVARGFASPGPTAECAAGLLRVGGRLVVSEPPEAAEGDGRWDGDGLGALGMRLESRHAIPWHFAVIRQDSSCPPRYPRRVGVPAKRPLF